MTDCLGIPLILREVLQHFSSIELIQLSLVNKQWNYEARSVMRNRGNLTANINKNRPCPDLTAFASDLRQMKDIKKIVPFSGMKISSGWWCYDDSIDWCEPPEQQQVYEDILDGLNWKHLTVKLFNEVGHVCSGDKLLKKILENFDSVLEELSIELDEWPAANYLTEQFLQYCRFSCLKTFRLVSESRNEATVSHYTGLIKTVVSRAPNLQVFYSTGEVDLDENLMEGSSAVHMAGYPYSLCEIPENFPSDLRLQKFSLYTFLPDSSLQKFNRITSTLLQSSRTTLSSIGLDVVFLVPLMVYGICLENVRTLEMSMDIRNLEKRQLHLWTLVKNFDFTRIFPNLDTVSIMYNSYLDSDITDEFNEMVEQVSAVLKTPKPDRAVNIKHLKLQHLPARILRRRSSFLRLAQMFPDIQKLSIKGNEIAYDDIRNIWLDLKEVHFKLNCSLELERAPFNLDSIFCGIFPEEVAQLKEQDEEYLRRVNIVPVMPPIAYLKELRTFTVSYDEDDDDDSTDYSLRPTDEPACTFSKVAGLVAIQRCTNVSVTLTTGNEELFRALSHLRPYASVVLKEKTSV